MTTLSIAGVPEHFNLPWRRLLESGALREHGIDATWQDFPGGTGAMGEALNGGALDVAMLLTEGAVAGIANGGSFRIVSVYTATPLIWGIHVPAASELASVDDVRGARYAISRFGSGSHLMAFAHARHMGWPVGELRFEIVGTLDGAVAAFDSRTADVFLWEKFMTKPLVDSGRFRRVGEFAAPWPAFVVCASARALRGKSRDIATALELVLECAARVASAPETAGEISTRYGIARVDAVEWLQRTRWAAGIEPCDAAVADVLDVLREVGLIAPGGHPEMTAALDRA